MATYTYDLSTAVGQVRLTIGDQVNDLGTAQFSDEELFYLLANTTPTDNVLLASIAALEILIRKFSTKPKLALGDYQEDYTGIVKSLEASAEKLRTLAGDEADDAFVAVGLPPLNYRYGWRY